MEIITLTEQKREIIGKITRIRSVEVQYEIPPFIICKEDSGLMDYKKNFREYSCNKCKNCISVEDFIKQEIENHENQI